MSDNILNAVLGGLEGVNRVLTPYLENQTIERGKLNLATQEYNMRKRPLGELAQLYGQPLKPGQDPNMLVHPDEYRLLLEANKPETKYMILPPGYDTNKIGVAGEPQPIVTTNKPFNQTPPRTPVTDKDIAKAKNQNLLAKEYRLLHEKVLSNRSGGLGLQDAKVNQASHLGQLLDQYYDPKSGTLNIPKSQYAELSLGLANLMSPTGQVSDSTRNEIIQKTGQGDINGALTYILGTPQSGSTPEVFKNLADSIDRQGLTSENLRNTYFEQMKNLRPVGLDETTATKIENSLLGNSYSKYLQSSPRVSKGSQQSNWTPAKEQRYQELKSKLGK